MHRSKPFLQIALNGSRTKADHPSVPVTPQELAADIMALSRLGATSFHLHVRNSLGQESLEPAHVAATLNAIGAVCPSAEVAISTAEGIAPTSDERLRLISEWQVWPDTLCVNLSEEGIDDIIAVAHARGLAFEAGLFTPDDVEHFRTLSEVRWRRILIEPWSTDLPSAEQELSALLKALGTPWLEIPHVIHGMDEATYPMLRRAATLTGASRIGFEDSLTLPDGSPAQSNAQLFQVGLSLLKESI